jgi:hypothetical protein
MRLTRSLALLIFVVFGKSLQASESKNCSNIESRIFTISKSWTVLGDRWLWSDTNVIVDKSDPLFKTEIIEIFKKQNQWESL